MNSKIKFYFPLVIFLSIIIASTYCFFSIKKNTDASIAANASSNIEKVAYLTIDDGPSQNTDKILEILDTYNIKATFFVIGPSYTLKDESLKKIAASGHEIAIHSYEHNYNHIYSSKENYIKDFFKCLDWIKKVTGQNPTLYRFPGGSSNTIASKELIKSIITDLKDKGYIHADWNVDTLDSYVKNDTSKIINNALTAMKKNENNNHYYQTILLHDDINKTASIKALPSLIEKIIAKGYHFEPLTQDSHIIKHVK